MKHLLTATALLTLTACSTGQIVTDVKVDSYQEEYEREVVTAPVMTEVEEQTLSEAPKTIATTETVKAEEPKTEPAAEPNSEEPKITVTQPDNSTSTESNLDANFKGYTIQIAAFDSEKRFNEFVKTIQTDKPIWKHVKQVNGRQMYAVLVGQYDTFRQSQVGAAEISAQMGISAPYIRNTKRIASSDSPKVVQVR